jgi:hypothetical protein
LAVRKAICGRAWLAINGSGTISTAVSSEICTSRIAPIEIRAWRGQARRIPSPARPTAAKTRMIPR